MFRVWYATFLFENLNLIYSEKIVDKWSTYEEGKLSYCDADASPAGI
jgi:hypothetical protein